jgi:hypothetical protein
MAEHRAGVSDMSDSTPTCVDCERALPATPADGKLYKCPCGASYFFLNWGDDESVIDLRKRPS